MARRIRDLRLYGLSVELHAERSERFRFSSILKSQPPPPQGNLKKRKTLKLSVSNGISKSIFTGRRFVAVFKLSVLCRCKLLHPLPGENKTLFWYTVPFLMVHFYLLFFKCWYLLFKKKSEVRFCVISLFFKFSVFRPGVCCRRQWGDLITRFVWIKFRLKIQNPRISRVHVSEHLIRLERVSLKNIK